MAKPRTKQKPVGESQRLSANHFPFWLVPKEVDMLKAIEACGFKINPEQKSISFKSRKYSPIFVSYRDSDFSRTVLGGINQANKQGAVFYKNLLDEDNALGGFYDKDVERALVLREFFELNSIPYYENPPRKVVAKALRKDASKNREEHAQEDAKISGLIAKLNS